MAEHLSPTDASMLAIEDPDHGIHIQIINVFEGTPPNAEEFRETVELRLLSAPRIRQRIARVRLNVGRPAWVDDERFDLDYHLRRTALPEPGGEDELRACPTVSSSSSSTSVARCGRCGSSRAWPTTDSR